MWLAYILTEGDHRKVSVETYIKGMIHTLRQLTAQDIALLDFRDDRLGHLLKPLSKPRYWHKIERDLHARSIEVYDLSQDVIRCDATTVSGAHEVTEAGLLQFGQSKDGSLVIPGVYIPLRNKGNTVSKGDRRMCQSGHWATLHILQ